jgi:hypothetical protein
MRLIEGYPALSPLPALRRLLRLEEDLRVARERLARIIRMIQAQREDKPAGQVVR